MRLEQSFEVPVPVAQAWGVLLDVERVAPCMPGATLTGFDGTAFTGTVKVKLGPVNLTFKGNGRFTERDDAGHRMSMVASGQDSRGGGGAQARVNAVLHDARGGDATLVKVVADLDISGKVAQFGRGMIADVSDKLVKQFADCLAQTIAESPAVAVPAAAAAAPAAAAPAAAEPGYAPSYAPAAEAASAPTPAPVDAEAPPSPPPAAPLFVEPTAPAPTTEPVAAEPAAAELAATEPAPAPPAYTPPPATNTNPPEYHPLAMQEPPPGAPTELPPPAGTPAWAQTEPVAQPESAYAYSPEPTPAPTPETTPVMKPVPARPVEAEPIDLLAISGAKGMLRKAAPVLIIVGLALIGLIVWLVAF